MSTASTGRIIMTSAATGWSSKILMCLMVCLLAVTTADDLWSIATASPNGKLLIVDDDDPDCSDERVPASASGRVGYIAIRCFVRMARVAIEQVDRRSAPPSRLTTRGPPNEKSHHREFQDALSSETVTVETAVALPFSPPRGRRVPMRDQAVAGNHPKFRRLHWPNNRTSRRPS